MNLTKLKNYAPAARTAFAEAVTRRAGVLGVHIDRVDPVTESGDIALIGGKPFPRSIVPLRKKLTELIQRDGFAHTMEAMAYTWFNRLVALRFMELHDGYLDHGYRVLSHPSGNNHPEILQHAEHVTLRGLNKDEVIRLKLDGNRDEELYRLLLLAQCDELSLILPSIFSRLDDATVLVLPDNLLHTDSLIRQLVNGSDEEDWKQVEVLGWLYQFYISEKKDAVMARKSVVPTEDIPAVTQLFTPHWIVRYLVENSLGRLWLLNRPNSRLREAMPYYIEGEAETDFLRLEKPEHIRLIDPACGSAHMLTYAFDLLVLIYEEEGYSPNEIPALILRHNLHGLDICPRAAQLAELALVLKAREKFRRFFQPSNLVRPRILALQDVSFNEEELRDYIAALDLGDLFNRPVLELLKQFESATTFGALIQPSVDEMGISALRESIEAKDLNGQLFLSKTHEKVLRVLEQSEALTQRYHVVAANPPYMGGRGMNSGIKRFLQDKFTDFESDLFAAFIVRSMSLAISNGYLGFMSPFVWMFISSYEKLRERLICDATITTLVQLEYSGFDGATVPICTFALKNKRHDGYLGAYVRLSDFRGSDIQGPKTLEAISNPTCGWFFLSSADDFKKIPGSPIAYWVSANFLETFVNYPSVSTKLTAKQGLATGNNARFVRFWFEVAACSTCFSYISLAASEANLARWVPYSKGGEFRRWYGCNEFVVDWTDGGRIIRNYCDEDGKELSRFRAADYYFKEAITWGLITSGQFSARYRDTGFVFDIASMSAFSPDNLYYLGLLNSGYSALVLSLLNPTLNYQIGDIKRIPLQEMEDRQPVRSTVSNAIAVARADWDNFETSWDFRDQSLLRSGLKGATLEASWRNWEAQSTAAIRRMQELETENNRLFIAAYGLAGELQPEVPEEQITLARADVRKDAAAFISYAVGCMMGRYSLEQPGLILANAGDTLSAYLEKVPSPSFMPDADGILPVTDQVWFDDDLVLRLEEFLAVTFGKDTLADNLQFLAASLGTKENESPRDTLRRYFQDTFYTNHLSGERAYGYKNRPIYWLFSSGKQKAFQCLVYLHRYTPGTLARMRTEYVIPLQGKLGTRITRLEEETEKATSSAARKKLQTEVDKAKKQMVELLAYDEQLRSYADQLIALDLDDGVKVNYAKFGPLVADAKKVCGTKDD
jgi:type II restriction/modification system DNA methylase subunit YeeA